MTTFGAVPRAHNSSQALVLEQRDHRPDFRSRFESWLRCGVQSGVVSLQQFSVICAANSSPVEISSLRLNSGFRLIMNACLAGSNVAKQTGTLSTTSDGPP